MTTTFPRDVFLYDTTLRDGTQRKGLSLSVADKRKIVGLLDEMGIPYIECGWPGSNPKDEEFFRSAREMRLTHAKIVAFGSTRRKGISPSEDRNLQALVESAAPAVALVGKTCPIHVEHILQATRDENLDMIRESVAFMRELGREVIYDAEHFFDGYKRDADYALHTLNAAIVGGAQWIVLCDTNGGSLPSEVSKIVREVGAFIAHRGSGTRLGIHTHNDSELAVANSLAALEAGALQVQGTINGYGERCGNANLISIAAILETKLAKSCLYPGALDRLTELSRRVAEICNVAPDTQAAFVGSSAFAHKGGIHVAAVEKLAESYEHIPPELVGNRREIVVSELSGRGNIRVRAQELDIQLRGLEGDVLDQIKLLESKGFQFENAEGSFELIMRRAKPDYRAPFVVKDMMVVSDSRALGQEQVNATVKVQIGSVVHHTVADGDGPVHALDGALRKALAATYPAITELRLTDYKVRILDPESATAAITRVTIEAAYGDTRWSTVGCSGNIIEASFMALADSFEYLLKVVLGAAPGVAHAA